MQRGSDGIYFNAAGMDEVSANQSSQLSQFTDLLAEIDEHAKNTLDGYDGNGAPEAGTDAEEFDTQFQEVLSAFVEFARTTDDTSDNFNGSLTKLKGIFQ